MALITGVTGQDGAYLAELLLEKGYIVHGIKRRSSSFNTSRIEHLYEDPHEEDPRFILHYGDMTDSTNLIRIVQETQPDEIYNLAAQSHVRVSFETPEYTANADGIGTLRLLEAIRLLGLTKKTRFYQASTSEALRQGSGSAAERDDAVLSALAPTRLPSSMPTGSSVNYREAYGMHASNGILFNHESPMRGETFVTRKITRAAAAIQLGLQDRLYLGNLDAKRDWGHAREYVRGMWLMLQQDEPDDYVLATGETHSVRSFVERPLPGCRHADRLAWRGRRGEGLRQDVRQLRGGDRSALFPPDRSRPSDRRPHQGAPEARLEARDQSRSADCRRWFSEDLKVMARTVRRGMQRGLAMPEMIYSLAGKKVYVAGHRGMVGSAIVRRLACEGCEILTAPRTPRSI